MSLLLQQAQFILEQTIDSRVGIVVRFNFQEGDKLSLYQVTRYLYKVRKDMNLPFIQMRASPDNPDSEIWLFKQAEEKSGTLTIGDIN